MQNVLTTRDIYKKIIVNTDISVKKGMAKMVKFGNDWDEVLRDQVQAPYFQNIIKQLNVEYRKTQCFPPPELVFNALRSTAYSQVRAVILGQDPYHGEGQAHGLCFSVQDGVPKPPSLENMLKELKSDLGCEIPTSGNLTAWAKQGVLLLNTSLSVRAHQANSHSKCGWAWFTDSVIKIISEQQ